MTSRSPIPHRRHAEGRWPTSYRLMGAHPRSSEGLAGTRFVLWAPRASRVSVVGPFNRWQDQAHPMRRLAASGLWERFVPEVGVGSCYRFALDDAAGRRLPLKADPYAFRTAVDDPSLSVVWDPDQWAWTDQEWMARRRQRHRPDQPIAIYEVHPGSWRRRGAAGRFLSWRELARELIPWVRRRGFTHIELMPVAEHPFYGSWGYQPTSLFAPTARYGPPDGLQFFVDRCHREGLGVLLDWVPGHFPEDPWGLADFDGKPLYEYPDPQRGRHPEWGSLLFDFSRPQVSDFLVSSALFWLDKYHLDGLRVDAVASMLYLDYARAPGEWVPNRKGGNEHLEAVAFLRRLNRQINHRHPGAITVAEESTAWPDVSGPVARGGLGFDYKWNMGWMNDTLDYIRRPPSMRARNPHKVTFGLTYAFGENYILPLSHDEVVYGKGSLPAKMPGAGDRPLASLRAYMAFHYTHPGKKLLFMGSELGQWREWSHDRALDWQLLADPRQLGIRRLVDDLNRLYRAVPALHRGDCRPEGFRWLDADDHRRGLFAFLRLVPGAGGEMALVLCNFSNHRLPNYRAGVPQAGPWRIRLDTNARRYGGKGGGPGGRLMARQERADPFEQSLDISLAPLTLLVLTPVKNDGIGLLPSGRR